MPHHALRPTSRREFLALSVAVGGAAALGAWPRLVRAGDAPPLRILVLGGTKMLGPAIIEAAIRRGHRVAMFNRNKTEAERGTVIPPEVERFVGDRDPRIGDGLSSLKGQRFDAVIDTSGLFPRMVRASAELLESQGAARYIFVSSISAYAGHATPNADESDPPVVPANPDAEESDPGFVYTGELKRPCEQAAQAVFGDRATIVRPSYLVGPGDASGRFAYWPLRVSECIGDRRRMLVPGGPDDPVQVVDVRDAAAWLIAIVERNIAGTFNISGPEKPPTVGAMLAACAAAAGTSPAIAWVPWQFLIDARQPVPILLPPDGDYAGFHRRNGAKALRAGFTPRPVRDTCADILAWIRTRPDDERAALRGGLSPEREAELLAQWDAQPSHPPHHPPHQ
jgi:2'-hydroxyisoflavone reductase